MPDLKRYLLLLLLITLLKQISFSQDKQPAFPFFFVQLTDPQFGFFAGNMDFEKEIALYSKAVEEINRIKPEFVVITGDLVNDKSRQEQWDEFIRLTSLIRKDIPIYITPGNHDIGNNPSDESIRNFTLKFGFDRFSFLHGKCLFIGLNSPIIKAQDIEREQEQFEWLKSKLEKAKNVKHIVVFSHHPFFIAKPDEPETYSNIGPETRSKYLALFKQYDVKLIFSGHYHNNAYGTYEGIEMVTTSAVGRPLGEASSGLRVVEVYRRAIKHSYYGIYDVPLTMAFEKPGKKTK